ncbi:hypothetical protein KR044_009479, partial [Drosophila immigrans]
VENTASSTHKIINRKEEANSQILKLTSGEYKHNRNMYKNTNHNQEKLTKLVMNGLGLKKLPDMKKANISQIEYSRKYIEYLERLRKNNLRKNSDDDDMKDAASSLQILSIVTNKFKDITRKRRLNRKRAIRSTVLLNNTLNRSRNHSILDESDKTNILLHFPLMINDSQFKYEQINEANVRLMILYNPELAVQSRSVEAAGSRAFRRRITNKYYQNHVQIGKDCKNDHNNSRAKSKSTIPNPSNRKRKKHVINLKVYQLLRLNKRQVLDARKIEFDNDNSNYSGTRDDETYSQWLEFDVTVAVRTWLNKTRENLGIEIQCDKCKRIGARILSEVSKLSPNLLDKSTSHNIHDKFHLTPVLNIIGQVGRTHSEEAIHLQTPNRKWSNQSPNDYFYHRYGQDPTKKFPNSCYRPHQRCCRHQLDVDFKNIKGFEFIIQPKTFDAGYCKGRCPPRHNPAHHHALLQSLMWQQDHNRVPRPCCVPSKLTEIEILHVDEDHSDKLKISTWSNMQVLECACS